MVAAGDLERNDCIMCGSCADGCPRGVIKYRFARAAAQPAESAAAAVGAAAGDLDKARDSRLAVRTGEKQESAA
jgi:ferredoxin